MNRTDGVGWSLFDGRRRAGGFFLAAAMVLAALAAPALAGESPPVAGGIARPVPVDLGLRAVGLPQLILFALFVAGVFCLTDWAFRDIHWVGTRPALWGGIVVFGAVAGLAASALTPLFFIGFPLGIILFGGAAVTYAMHRNSKVTESQTVLTKAHLERLKDRLAGRGAEQARGPVTGVGRDIIFMGMDDLPIRLEGEKAIERQANQETERILFEAIVRRSTMMGLVMRGQKAQIRLRVDGQVIEGGELERPLPEYVAANIKRLAGLDTQEVRRPQEGRFRAVIASQNFELRVKTAGTVRGEQIAVRIVDLAAARKRLEDLGMPEAQLETLKTALGNRPGIVVLSGPKDSGLSSTLLACLSSFDLYVNTVAAFQSHVDLEVENIQHIALNQEDAGAAAEEVRRRLRTEPDIIGIDTLYAPQVAQLLAEAAMERMVLVGLRAGDASQALARLAGLLPSVEPLAKRLHLVMNQRLVRQLCPDCKEAYRPNPEFLRKANLGSQKVDLLYRPPGHAEQVKGKPVVCQRCSNVRYAGRTGLFELMPVDDEAKALISGGAGVSDIRTHARKLGMRNLQEEGLQMVIEGKTSVEEVLRTIKQAK